MLQERLCNEVHQSSLRDRFFAMRWNDRRETFDKFAWRLRSASLLLPDKIDDGLLLNRLKTGLPIRLQDHAKLVSGSFDEVVSRVSSLSSAQSSRVEVVREIKEDRTPTDRFANVQCHYCQNLGHISCDCEKKKSDKQYKGKEHGNREGPARPCKTQN